MKNEEKQNNFRKWLKIIRCRCAIVGSDGQINPREEDISDDHIYFSVSGGPIKIALIAAQYRRNHRRNRGSDSVDG